MIATEQYIEQAALLPALRSALDLALNERLIDAGDLLTIRDLQVMLPPGQGDFVALILLCLFLARGEGSLCLSLNAARPGQAGQHPFIEILLRNIPALGEEDAAVLELSNLAKAATKAVLDGRSPLQKIVGHSATDYLPLLVERGDGDTYLFFQKYLAAKRRVLSRLDQIFAQIGEAKKPNATDDAPFEEVFRKHPICNADGAVVSFTEEQCLACVLGLTRPFSLISGGPGTGKTTIILNLLRLLVRSGVPADAIALAAPTGRAAERMSEAIQMGIATIPPADKLEPADQDVSTIAGVTIHRLLKVRTFGPDRYSHNQSNPLGARVLIVDETSMVDITLMADLLEAIDPMQTRVIFLGDPDQLPSVDAGAVLADLVRLAGAEERAPAFSPAILATARRVFPEHKFSAMPTNGPVLDRAVILQQSHRSVQEIQNAAAWLESGASGPSPFALIKAKPDELHEALRLATDGAFHIALDTQTPDQLTEATRQVVKAWFAWQFNQEFAALVKACVDKAIGDTAALESLLRPIFARINGGRVLCLVRHGSSGVNAINRLGVETITTARTYSHRNRVTGMPIVITKNDHSQKLFNGNVGVLLRFADSSLRGVFPSGNTFRLIPEQLLPPWEPAFAHTVHKGQGSEYERVLLLLPDDEKHRLLRREVVYTGITRAKRAVYVLGTSAALEAAARRVVVRETGA